MRSLILGIFVALLGALAFSPVVRGQAGRGEAGSVPAGSVQAGAGALDNTLYNKLEKDPSTGGPAPKRDLNGVWAGPLNAVASEQIPPMTPLGKQRFSLNKPEATFGTAGGNDPLKTCDPLGLPRNLVFETRGIAFSTMPNKVVVLHQYQRIWRDIWTDGRELPKNVDAKGGPESRWYGYSVGHWDGDYTFVIDSTGSDDRSWLDTAGHPHSVDARVQERYTRVDHNHLSATVTVDDPKMYTKPFTLAVLKFRWIPNQETEEQLCVPSEALAYSDIIAIPAGR
jgi:hypothetical protein